MLNWKKYVFNIFFFVYLCTSQWMSLILFLNFFLHMAGRLMRLATHPHTPRCNKNLIIYFGSTKVQN